MHAKPIYSSRPTASGTQPRRRHGLGRGRRLVGAAVLIVSCAVGLTAHADTPPSVWDRAKNSSVRLRWAAHRDARMLMGLDSQSGLPSLRDAALGRARKLLEDVGAATSPDVRLRFDLGEIYETLGEHVMAIEILQSALALAPEHPAAENAYATLAYAFAKLDRPREERDAYRRYLSHVTDDRARSTALLNLAEAEMRIGNLQDAVAGYEDAIQVAASVPNFSSISETGILAVWGLAVTLDRAGDSVRSYEQAALATRMDPGEALIGHGPNVFFVPAYERIWYLALGATVHAREATDIFVQLTCWSRVEDLWSAYIVAAESTDRWLALAKIHRDKARAERTSVEKRIKASPRPRAPIGPDPLE